MKNIAMDIYQCPSCKGWHLGRTREASRCADRITQVLDRHAAALAKRMEGRNG
ncbi:hypothetical protein [Sphingobium chungbukense]|uniref:hypothetical protein n=1 Tax=Sphingobium chungbukense TaxID=56193 RepID=UPI0012EE50FE|nr:hypothetical protein [Sphingobium chungbukense]